MESSLLHPLHKRLSSLSSIKFIEWTPSITQSYNSSSPSWKAPRRALINVWCGCNKSALFYYLSIAWYNYLLSFSYCKFSQLYLKANLYKIAVLMLLILISYDYSISFGMKVELLSLLIKKMKVELLLYLLLIVYV